MVSHVLKGDLPSGPQDPPCLAKRAGLVRGTNDAELSDDEVELVVAEGQVQRIGLLP
jgi:hypothetical protein